MLETEIKTGIIILAAGNSSRLGQPKQLLTFKDTTLLKNTIEAASLLPNAIVVVVVGFHHELIKKELNSSKIKISFNENWQSGMSSSIAKGMNDLLLINPDIEKCIISVSDQPFISHSVFENLIEEYNKKGKGIVASSYAETVGTPALFDKKYFKDLLELKGQEGAKKILAKFQNDLNTVSFERGNIDIDTPEDYDKLMAKF